MAKYQIKMDGNSPQMKELSKMEELALNKKKKTVSLTLTKTMLEHMRKAAGIDKRPKSRVMATNKILLNIEEGFY